MCFVYVVMAGFGFRPNYLYIFLFINWPRTEKDDAETQAMPTQRDANEFVEARVDIRKFSQFLVGQQVNPLKVICSKHRLNFNLIRFGWLSNYFWKSRSTGPSYITYSAYRTIYLGYQLFMPNIQSCKIILALNEIVYLIWWQVYFNLSLICL